jgi:hypothetical protein
MQQTIQKALVMVLKDKTWTLSPADRAHLNRWIDEGKMHDAVWQPLPVGAEKAAILPPGSACESIIREALFARAEAERAASGIDFNLRDQQQQRERCTEG